MSRIKLFHSAPTQRPWFSPRSLQPVVLEFDTSSTSLVAKLCGSVHTRLSSKASKPKPKPRYT